MKPTCEDVVMEELITWEDDDSYETPGADVGECVERMPSEPCLNDVPLVTRQYDGGIVPVLD